MPVDEPDFMGGSIEYEEISEVNILNENTRSDKTLNELEKILSISKTDAVLNHEHTPFVSIILINKTICVLPCFLFLCLLYDNLK